MSRLNYSALAQHVLRLLFCTSVGYAIGFDRGAAIGLAIGSAFGHWVEGRV